MPDIIELSVNGVAYDCAPVEPGGNDLSDLLVPYSQNDPRWANEIYSYSQTFAKTGCLVCCVAMIASMVYADSLHPPDVAFHLKSAGAFVGDFLSKPARITDALALLTWGGAVHWRVVPADMVFLAKELKTYGATIAEVKWAPSGPSPESGNQHFVVISEITPNGDVVINDPWDGETKLLSASRYRLGGWSTARALYGLRLVRPLVEACDAWKEKG